VIDARTSRITLTADAIELQYQWLLPPIRLRRDEIAGRRSWRTRSREVFQLVPVRQDQRTLSINLSYDTDFVLDDWIAALPDLDKVEAQRAEEAVASNAALGPTRDVRLARLATARRIATWMNYAAFAVGTCWLLYSRPNMAMFAVLATLPWLAILLAWRSGGLYSLAGIKNDARANLLLVWFFPGILLALSAVKYLYWLRWQNLIAPAALAAGIVVAAAYRADPMILRDRTRRGFALVLAAGAYGFGAVGLANQLLDGSPRQVYRTGVEGTRISRGSKSASWYVDVGPWGPRSKPEEISVSRHIYDTVARGDTVCVIVGSGAIGVPWYRLDLCER
jgi:hypothetical protein